jgi:hypothetical protein
LTASRCVARARDDFRRLARGANGDGDLPPASTDGRRHRRWCSGLTTAYLIRSRHQVTPFEAVGRLGEAPTLVVWSIAGVTVSPPTPPDRCRQLSDRAKQVSDRRE